MNMIYVYMYVPVIQVCTCIKDAGTFYVCA